MEVEITSKARTNLLAHNVTTKKEYAWIFPYGEKPLGATYIVRDEAERREFEGIGFGATWNGSWNVGKLKVYRKTLGMVKLMLESALSDIDQEKFTAEECFKTAWGNLYAKYSKILPSANVHNITELNNFKLRDNKIEDGWATLRELRRKVVAQQPSLALAYDEDALIAIFLRGLPDSFLVTKQALEAQVLDVTTILNRLQVAEDGHKTPGGDDETEKAMAAYRGKKGAYKPPQLRGGYDKKSEKHQHKRQQDSSDSEEECPKRKKPKCYLCDKRHFVVQ